MSPTSTTCSQKAGDNQRYSEICIDCLRGGARPPQSVIVDYIDTHKQAYGVEPICRVLSAHGCKIAPSTYYDACVRRTQPSKRQAGLPPAWLTPDL